MADAENPIEEIRKGLKEKKLVIGANTVMRNLRAGKLKKIFLASNPPKTAEEDIVHYAKIAECPVAKLAIANDELGIICKKQFLVAVVGMLK